MALDSKSGAAAFDSLAACLVRLLPPLAASRRAAVWSDRPLGNYRPFDAAYFSRL